MFPQTEFPSSIIVQRLDGTIYDLGKMGFRVISFDPPSPNWQHTFQQVGKYGADLVNSEVQQTTIPIVLDGIATDNWDLELQRLSLRNIFTSDEPFYVISMRTPYLRYKVVADTFSINQLNSYHKLKSVTINLLCADGYAESTATTLTPFTYEAESWGIGMNLPNGIDLNYVFSVPSFKVYNASIIPLTAEERPVSIIFKGVAPNGVKITNNTTGQSINVYKALTANDTLIWKGLVPVLNGSQIYGNGLSDHGYLDLAKGWNDIVVSGATNFTISFETRFYY